MRTSGPALKTAVSLQVMPYVCAALAGARIDESRSLSLVCYSCRRSLYVEAGAFSRVAGILTSPAAANHSIFAPQRNSDFQTDPSEPRGARPKLYIAKMPRKQRHLSDSLPCG